MPARANLGASAAASVCTVFLVLGILSGHVDASTVHERLRPRHASSARQSGQLLSVDGTTAKPIRRLLVDNSTDVPHSSSPPTRFGVLPPEVIQRNILLINGSGDDSFTFSFFPEPGAKGSDYDIRSVSSRHDILRPETDIELSFAESGTAVNVSCALDFHSFPGVVTLTLEVWRTADSIRLNSITIDYLAAGLVIYRREADGSRTILSGFNRSLHIPDYRAVLDHSIVQLGVYVQYLNGTNSDMAPVSMQSEGAGLSFGIDSIQMTWLSNRGHVHWDMDACKLDLAEWNGTEVTLHDGCGMGLAMGAGSGSSYEGIHFAVQFERYRAGDLGLLFEWDPFTFGTEFEDEFYTNFLQMSIGGSPPAFVRLIYPANEFPSEGNTTLYVEMINADNVSITGFSVAGVDDQFPMIPGSYKQYQGESGYFETVKFRTLPGTGKNLAWTVVATRDTGIDVDTGIPIVEMVPFTDLTGFLFSYDDAELIFSKLVPSVVREEGGETVTLMGSFEGFDPSDRSHQIVFSNKVIDSRLIQSVRNASILITAPSRTSVGLAWAYSVQVRKGYDTSKAMRLVYAETNMTIKVSVFGASFLEESGGYEIGPCSKLTVSAQGSKYVDCSYVWSLITSDGIDLLKEQNASSIVKNQSSILMSSDYLPIAGAYYELHLYIENQISSATWATNITRSGDPVIGVTILSPANRTVSQPAVSLRVITKIELPTCIGAVESIVYEWYYENKSETILSYVRKGLPAPSAFSPDVVPQYSYFLFSALNKTGAVDGGIGPVRLGRELVVARSKLQRGLNRIRLRVYIPAAQPSVRVVSSNETSGSGNDFQELRVVDGIAYATVTVESAPLIAMIGVGERTRTAPDGVDLLMSAAGSFDPDAALHASVAQPYSPSAGLTYLWACETSLFANMTNSRKCGDSLLSPDQIANSEFVVRSSYLKNLSVLKSPDAAHAYIRYSLSVSKDERTSTAYQDVWIRSGTIAAQYVNIKISNGVGEVIDPAAVNYWEEVIIRPIIATQIQDTSISASWTFDLVSPRHLRLSLFGGNSLLSEPGYYLPSGPSNLQYQSAPLGIRAGALTPHQEYVFSLNFLFQSSTGEVSQNVVTFSVTTVEKPNIIFPPVLTPNVTLNDVVRASAYVDVDNDQMFKYQFYLIREDDLINSSRASNEYCVDGCTGAPEVRFYVFNPGTYVLQARLIAADGKAVLDFVDNEALISASDVPTNRSIADDQEALDSAVSQHGDMVHDFMLGNDGAVNQRAFWITKYMYENRTSNSIDEDESCTEIMRNWVNMTENIVSKELPITANMRNYIDIATNYARLSCIEGDQSTLYQLLQIVVQVLGQSPPENTLQMNLNAADSQLGIITSDTPNVDVINSLQAFYNFSISRAFNSVAGHTTRSRLQPVPSTVNNLILDLFELWRAHVTMVSTSAQVCGWSRIVRSDIQGGYSEYALVPERTSGEPPLGLNQITVAVMCNSENGMSIEGAYSRFEWCKNALPSFENASAESRMLVTLAEMSDYVYLSGIQGSNKTDTKRLVAIDISTLGSKNYLVPASPIPSGALTKSANGQISSSVCYTLGIEMLSASSPASPDSSVSQTPVKTLTRNGSLGKASEGVISVFRIKPFTLSPTKEYGTDFSRPFESDAYGRQTNEVFLADDRSLSNDSYVTMKTSRLGLFGALREQNALASVSWSQDVTGLAVSLLGILILILFLLLVVTVLIYFLASTLLESGADPADDFIERDYFGRGEINLKAENDGDSESDSGASE
jgi:hypothetical protein